MEVMNDDQIKEYYDLYLVQMPKYKNQFKQILENHHCSKISKDKLQTDKPMQYHLYTFLLQKFGNNIRSSGDPFVSDFNQEKLLLFAERIDLFIRLIRHKNKKKSTRICIDAIRNANESNYIKSIYRNYYLISISVEDDTRKRRLRNINAGEINNIDQIEFLGDYKAEAFFYQQNILQCFEMADIHIYNKEVELEHKFFLTQQLMRYIVLMIHPGLVTPTHVERCMQLAFNAKYNSGCLSRQVGAIVTGQDYSVKAVGWNDVPKGHFACNLRDLKMCVQETQVDYFSQYEMSDPSFRKAIKNISEELKNKTDKINLGGRRFPYCFKDIYNGYTHERNQVYTRSLHAEENAFLQISKYGGQGVRDGKLFVTASPCELCSKKSYQLGIQEIYYIDPYPGISERHIINAGIEQNRPHMKLFYGAIGEAYISLYRPLMPYKDELELISGCNPRTIAQSGGKSNWREPNTNDFIFNNVEFTLEFEAREIINCTRKVEGVVDSGTHQFIDKKLIWTGSSYDGSSIIDGDCRLEEMENVPGAPIHYRIIFNEEKKKGDNISYTIKTKLKDETHIMNKFLSNIVLCPTDKLTLKVIAPNDNFFDDVKYKRYADKEMETEFPDEKNTINKRTIGDKTEYIVEIEKPNLFYTYCIEWEFIKLNTD